MASTTSPEASEIRRKGRQRLIGAIAIAVMLVVFVPMILDSEPRPSRSGPSTDIPSRDKAAPLPPASAPLIPHRPLPPVTPVETGAQPKQASSPETPQKAPDVTPAKASEVTPAKAGAQLAPPKPSQAPQEPPKATAAATPTLAGFAVQVGAFKDDEKLKQAREKLAAVGVPHYTERRDGTNGELTRLRAGPFPTREAAEAALARIKLGALDGQVVPLP